MKRNILWLFAIAVCLAQIAFAQEPAPSANSRGYLIGPGDVIEGKVLGEPDFNFTATVNEDGNFEVPFFDKPVSANCRTEKELRSEIMQMVAKYVRNPQVSVQVRERKSRPSVTIYGEVRNAQQIELRRKARLFEIISFAGGLTKDAGGTIQVFRPRPPVCAENDPDANWKSAGDEDSDVPSRVFSYSKVRLNEDDSNPMIMPGDLIYVRKALPVYVIGEVVALRELAITENGLSLLEAVSQVGGPNRQAKTKDITILRLKPDAKNNRDRETISANYELIRKGQQKDIMLQPEDIVVIDKAKKTIGQTILEIATGSIRSTASVLPQTILP